ncbi:hypothetical protein ACG2DA_08635 [Alienimonas sp. DA493]
MRFQESMAAARILTKIGSIGLRDLPGSLPETEREEVAIAWSEHYREIKTNGLPWIEIKEGHWVARPTVEEKSELGIANDVWFIMERLKQAGEDHSLLRMPFEQCLIVCFAQFDALLGDLVRAVAEQQPNILALARTTSWNDIVRAGSYDNVLTHFAEELADEFSRGDIRSKLDNFKKRFGIEITPGPNTMRNLLIAEQARNAFTHTGGKITKGQLAKCELPNGQPGQQIYLDHQFCVGLTRALADLALNMVVRLEQKFWKLTHDSYGEVDLELPVMPKGTQHSSETTLDR